MILAQAEVIIPVWLVIIVIAVPSAVVASTTIFSNQRKSARTQAKALVNEMILDGKLPSATKQVRVINQVTALELSMVEMSRSVESIAQAQRAINGDLPNLIDNQAATDAKVDVLMEHFDLEI